MSEHRELSKFLSFVLRHQPQAIGLELGDGGWVSIAELLSALLRHGKPVERELLEQLVRSSDKQRFAFSADGSAIRANQGHSVPIDLGLASIAPPQWLFHGTVERFIMSIRRQGLLKGERHHVHLADTRELGLAVGRRRGKPLLLEVESARMAAEGHAFFRSQNGVWLTEHVPVRFIHFPSPAE